jgi:hypothetical protein
MRDAPWVAPHRQQRSRGKGGKKLFVMWCFFSFSFFPLALTQTNALSGETRCSYLPLYLFTFLFVLELHRMCMWLHQLAPSGRSFFFMSVCIERVTWKMNVNSLIWNLRRKKSRRRHKSTYQLVVTSFSALFPFKVELIDIPICRSNRLFFLLISLERMNRFLDHFLHHLQNPRHKMGHVGIQTGHSRPGATYTKLTLQLIRVLWYWSYSCLN